MIYKSYNLPVAFINVAVGGSSVNEWKPGGKLFSRLEMVLTEMGPNGIRAILWHQGETDKGMSSEDYYEKLKEIISSTRKRTGWDIPWMVAQASYANGSPSETVTSAQKRLWKDGVALKGPNTDLLKKDFRGEKDVHFNAKGSKRAAELWSERISNAFFD